MAVSTGYYTNLVEVRGAYPRKYLVKKGGIVLTPPGRRCR